ncbi:MAG: KamA family radical SAM protein [Oligoflexales bacterium]
MTSADSTYLDLPFTRESASRWDVDPKVFANWRWQIKHQIRTLEDAEKFIILSEDERIGFEKSQKLFNSGVTPYYAALMAPDPTVSCPIRLQANPRVQELVDEIGEKDPLLEKPHSPVPEVVQVYPDRVAFCVAQLCPVYCRYCFRKRRDDEDGLHFNRKIIEAGVEYIRSQPAIKDVLITGGDPFVASDGALENLLVSLREIKHVEMIRFGTRTPVTLPYRITDDLCKMLSKFHPIWVNTHFNCVQEITEEAAAAAHKLTMHGIPVSNQSVLLKGINDDRDSQLALLRGLLRIRVRPYYLFHPHKVEGTAHLRVPLLEGLKLMRSLRGNITGLAIPNYVLDTPSGKIPLEHNYKLSFDGPDLVIEDVRGEIWREKDVL